MASSQTISRKSIVKGMSDAQRFDILSRCIEQGFKLITVHFTRTDGSCSCRNPECTAIGKHPKARIWQRPENQVATHAELEAAFQLNKYGNWGLATGPGSGVFIPDIDAKNNGFQSLEKLESERGRFSKTLTQSTGGGGKHIFFRYPDGVVIKNSAGTIAPGIDIRGDNGQIVISPSMHKSGKRYTFDILPGDIEIAEAPQWLIDLVSKPARTDTAPILSPEQIAEYQAQHQRFQKSGETSHGRRYVDAVVHNEIEKLATTTDIRNVALNNAVYNVARYIPSGLIFDTEIYQAFYPVAIAIGLTPYETNKTIYSAMKAGPLKPKLPPSFRDRLSPRTGSRSTVSVSHATNVTGAEPATKTTSSSTATITHRSRMQQEYDDFEDINKFVAVLPGTGIRLKNYPDLDESDTITTAEQEQTVKSNAFQRNIISGGFVDGFDRNHASRCNLCNCTHRLCRKCSGDKIKPVNEYPTHECRRPHVYHLQHKTTGARSGGMCRCGQVVCQPCRFDYEVDHLINFLSIFSSSTQCPAGKTPSTSATTTLFLPDPEIDQTQPIPTQVKNAVYRLDVPQIYAKKYVKRLSKNKVLYIRMYTNQYSKTYTFYMFLPPDVSASILNYRLIHEDGSVNTHSPKIISFSKFEEEYRSNLGKYGVDILPSEDNCDDAGTVISTTTVHLVRCSKRLNFPKRVVPTGEFAYVNSPPSFAHMVSVCESKGVVIRDLDPSTVDRSHKRGMSRMLLRRFKFIFPAGWTETDMQEFDVAMSGRGTTAWEDIDDNDSDDPRGKRRRRVRKKRQSEDGERLSIPISS